MSATRALVVAALVAAPAAAAAQVGHAPASTPYRDYEHRHELGVHAGWLASQRDPARVAYRGGPLLGGRYEFHLGGPAYVFGRLAVAYSERSVRDPAAENDDRVVEERASPLLLADAGFALSLTGHKGWHGLSPVVQAGVGTATDFRAADVGGYRFGTPLALTAGGGVRWRPGGRVQLRLDVTDHLYRISYPERFYRATGDNPPLLDPAVARKRWTHNAAITVGLSYLFGR